MTLCSLQICFTTLNFKGNLRHFTTTPLLLIKYRQVVSWMSFHFACRENEISPSLWNLETLVGTIITLGPWGIVVPCAICPSHHSYHSNSPQYSTDPDHIWHSHWPGETGWWKWFKWGISRSVITATSLLLYCKIQQKLWYFSSYTLVLHISLDVVLVQFCVACVFIWKIIRKSTVSKFDCILFLQSKDSIYLVPYIYGNKTSLLTHLPLDKMAGISQTFSNACSWMKKIEFWLKFHWNLFVKVQLTITQHWYR